jgi:UDP-glucose 4-epimerase
MHRRKREARMKVMVTGGAGYLGSHVCVALASAGYQPVIVDNFSRGSPAVLERLALLMDKAPTVERGDLLDTVWLRQMLQQHQPGCVMHLANYNGRLETMADRLRHLSTTLAMLASVLRAMEAQDIHTLQIASSAEVYGGSERALLSEFCTRRPQSSAGHVHHMVENLLQEMREVNPAWRMAVLRHFNPAGAHVSGLIGDTAHRYRRRKLLPCLVDACLAPNVSMAVRGWHCPSTDGSLVRDYTHIQDVAEAHVAALETQLDYGESFCANIGTGQGHSIFEVIDTFERVNRQTVPWHFADSRNGDLPRQVAQTELAKQLMAWRARRSLDDICTDAFRWHVTAPYDRERLPD